MLPSKPVDWATSVPSLASAHATCFTLSLVLLFLFCIRRFLNQDAGKVNTLSYLPEAPRSSWLLGNRLDRQVNEDEPGKAGLRMLDEAGADTIAFPDVLGTTALLTRDPAVIAHVLSDSTTYQRSPATSKATRILIGDGIVAAFGDDHRNQRKLLGPAFATEALREYVPTMLQVSHQMIGRMANDKEAAERYADDAVIDVIKWLSRATLDIIGLAGFDFDFEAVKQGHRASSIRDSFDATITALMNMSVVSVIVTVLGKWIAPSTFFLPITPDNVKIMRMRRALIACSEDIIARKRVELEQELQSSRSGPSRKDIIHQLMRANLKASARFRLTDEELVGQCVTFIFAGHETTATAVAWALLFLSRDQKVQGQVHLAVDSALLRWSTEIRDLTWDNLHDPALNTLDRIVLETLRLRPSVSETLRQTMRADTIPLLSPVKSPNGGMLYSTDILPGTNVTLAISANMLDAKLFGPNASTFDPSRWDQLPALHATAKFPAYGSFAFNAGPKSCLGQRFALLEMKILLMTILHSYTVLPVSGVEIRSIEAIIQRPAVRGREKEGSQMPLRLVRRTF